MPQAFGVAYGGGRVLPLGKYPAHEWTLNGILIIQSFCVGYANDDAKPD